MLQLKTGTKNGTGNNFQTKKAWKCFSEFFSDEFQFSWLEILFSIFFPFIWNFIILNSKAEWSNIKTKKG